MTERPILFNDAMVRAILRGQKTQTRRPVMPQPVIHPDAPKPFGEWTHKGQKIQWGPGAFPTLHFARHCPFGQPDDLLWVREAFAQLPGHIEIAYRADFDKFTDDDCLRWPPKWHPSIHMPRALSRITLEINDINVERVWDITDPEAIAEGAREINHVGDNSSRPTWTMGSGMERYDSPREAFAAAWDSIYAKRGLGWRVNPWVWVVKFKRVEGQCNQG